jgi:hypothetical protein
MTISGSLDAANYYSLLNVRRMKFAVSSHGALNYVTLELGNGIRYAAFSPCGSFRQSLKSF